MATAEWGDTFDHYYSPTALGNGTFATLNPMRLKWTGVSADDAGWLIGPAYARPGAAGGHGFAGTNANRSVYKTLPGGAQATRSIGAWVKTQPGAGSLTIMGFLDAGNGEQCSVRTDSSSRIIVSRNGTTIATSTNTLSSGTWYHIEFKATINNTTGVVEVRVNGTSTGWIASTSSLNTRGQTNNSAVAVFLQGNGLYFDDFLVCDDFAGPVVGAFLRPAAPGNSSQWTANSGTNHGAVDDQYPDDDLSFTMSSTAGQIDLFTMDDLPAPGTPTVIGVQHVIYARQDAGAARTIRPKQRSSSTNYNGTTVATTASYAMFTEMKPTNPATSSAWSKSDVDGAEFGYELVS